MRKTIDTMDITASCPMVATTLRDKVNCCLPYPGELAPRGEMMFYHHAIDTDMALCIAMKNSVMDTNIRQIMSDNGVTPDTYTWSVVKVRNTS